VQLIPLLAVAFLLYCVLDVVRSRDDEIRNLPRMVWLALVVLLPVLGGVVWLIAGRPVSSKDAEGPRRRPSAGSVPAPRRPRPSAAAPRGPDDDPEFLARLDRRLRGRDEQDPDV
jgi:hypothetical protein